MVKKATPVHVELTTVMEQDGQQERFHFTEDGQFVNLNGKYYLRYHEHQQGQTTPVQFRLNNDELHLRRSGIRETVFTFLNRQTTKARYQTEYGIIDLEVTTNRLLVDFDPIAARGNVDLEYQLVSGNQLVGTYQLQLQFSR
ncbi:hypothetical protein FD27_GL001518 [Limosilactobacillus frumenti DSM 13145]|uniref:DUF1934 domain-containing protein n=1 Tax=Limosilactobacillus frumenti DSM 13145 TaxID=1423746 RepID=A0A0R1P8D9_9LACO|nr:DUF1934 domain-containing protein [Limosilactobacillus frumenti]KRL28737.1 hypothetical protein FD27_GL001518 [Limosilactobacillus frumenti DSM 13145]